MRDRIGKSARIASTARGRGVDEGGRELADKLENEGYAAYGADSKETAKA